MYPTCIYAAPPLGVTPSEFWHVVGSGKTEMIGYQRVKSTSMIHLAALTQYAGLWKTDAQTDTVITSSSLCIASNKAETINIHEMPVKLQPQPRFTPPFQQWIRLTLQFRGPT